MENWIRGFLLEKFLTGQLCLQSKFVCPSERVSELYHLTSQLL